VRGDRGRRGSVEKWGSVRKAQGRRWGNRCGKVGRERLVHECSCLQMQDTVISRI